MAAVEAGVETGVEASRSVDVRSVELARRAGAIAHADLRGREVLGLSHELTRQIEAAERRARSLAGAGGRCEESRRAAALDFVGAVAAAFTVDPDIADGVVSKVVAESAAAVGISRGAANLAVFQRTLASPQVSELPPRLAYRSILQLIVELGPADAVSLWTAPSAGRLECVASAGEAAKSRRLRVAARVLLAGGELLVADETKHVRRVSVERWDRSHAALMARGRPEAAGRLAVYLTEAAAALSRFFERERLFERNEDSERVLVSASERRLTRLGCDLHDGPLQDIVALADDLRLARRQVASLLDVDHEALVDGRFDDLEARLASLDQGLRDISRAIRSTRAIERPLEDALRTEIDELNRTGALQGQLAIEGDLSGLTASQKIVLFRVVQESLSNARRHSDATRTRVRVRSTLRYISVVVSDNGCGFDVAAARRSGRLGLTGVIERVRLLGGDIEIQSSPGCGTRVLATLPRWSRATDQAVSVYAVTA